MPDTAMNFKPEDISQQTADRYHERLIKEYRKSLSGMYLTRYFRAFRWRYNNNPTFRDVVDLVWITVLGGLCAVIFAVSIVQYLKPWLND